MNKLKKGIVLVFIANVINMAISILTNFVLPKFLSVDSYAAIKTFQLYVGVVGVFAFGFTDGMFLKYGGASLDTIDREDLNVNLSSFRIYQAVIMLIVVVVSLLTRDAIFVLFSFTILPLNCSGYFKSFYQAIGEFKRYSRLMNISTGLTFIVNMLLLFVFRVDDYRAYLILYVVIYLFVWIGLEISFSRILNLKFSPFLFSRKETIKNIKDGILLMFGNLTNSLLTSMDRWFIKALMTTFDFAQYSFACSMETMVNVAVTPITVTLYNYFCNEKRKERVIFVRNCMTVVAALFVSCGFAAKFILETFLQKYMESVSVLFYLFAAQIFYIVIKSVYVNLYKAYKLQNKYFARLVIVIISGAIFNILCYLAMRNKEAFAIGTLLSAILWFVLCVYDFSQFEVSPKYIAYLICSCCVFMLIGSLCSSILGILVYLFAEVLLSILLMNHEFRFLVNNTFKMLGSKLRR